MAEAEDSGAWPPDARRAVYVLLTGRRSAPPRKATWIDWMSGSVEEAPRFVEPPLARVYPLPPLARAAWALLALAHPPHQVAAWLERDIGDVLNDARQVDDALGDQAATAREQLRTLLGQRSALSRSGRPLPPFALAAVLAVGAALLTVLSPLVAGPVTVATPGTPAAASTGVTSLAYGSKQVGLLEMIAGQGFLAVKGAGGWTSYPIHSLFQLTPILGAPWAVSWFGVEGLDLVPSPFVDSAVPAGFPAGRFVVTAGHLWTASATLQEVSAARPGGLTRYYPLPAGISALSLTGAPQGGAIVVWWAHDRLTWMQIRRVDHRWEATKRGTRFRLLPDLMSPDPAGSVLLVVGRQLWSWTPGGRPVHLTALAVTDPLYLEPYGQGAWIVGDTHAELITDSGQRQALLNVVPPEACAVSADGDLWVYASGGLEIITPH
jgi:hypothetical protein